MSRVIGVLIPLLAMLPNASVAQIDSHTAGLDLAAAGRFAGLAR